MLSHDDGFSSKGLRKPSFVVSECRRFSLVITTRTKHVFLFISTWLHPCSMKPMPLTRKNSAKNKDAYRSQTHNGLFSTVAKTKRNKTLRPTACLILGGAWSVSPERKGNAGRLRAWGLAKNQNQICRTDKRLRPRAC